MNQMASDGVPQGPLYSPLADNDEIRLLCLHPNSSGDSTPKCTLKHVSRLQKPSYEALSYMWGPPQPKQLIELNGKNCEVGENLWQALVHLRHQIDPRHLWVDALCINQLDVQERNHQVAQMGEIYRQATRVVAWLGISDSQSSQAISVLRTFYAVRESSGLWRSEPWTNFNTARLFEEAESLCHLFTLPYWRRL